MPREYLDITREDEQLSIKIRKYLIVFLIYQMQDWVENAWKEISD